MSTKKELINMLNSDPDFKDDDIVILVLGKGWCNIDSIQKQGSSIGIIGEDYPLFSKGE